MAIRTTGVRYDLIARDSASRTFNSVGSSASRLERGLGKLGKAAIAAGAALTVGVAAGLAEGAKKAVEFQSEMLKIQTQAGASAKDVKILSAQVLELGKTTQQGPQKLSEALYHLKSVGMDNVDAMQALKTASDLAAVGGADLEATTNALAGAWRTGIKGAETFSKTASTVNAVLGAGNMRMEDFVSAIGTGILPSAKAFGLSLNQVGAALALMTDEGIPATDAATRLRMSFSLLGAPSKAAEKQLAKIHLTGLQLATAMRGKDGLIGAITLLKTHLDASGMSAAQQSQILSRAFGGGRSSSGILTLLNNLDVLRKKQDQVNGSMSKYAPAVQAQRKTAAAQLKIIESNLEVFAIKTGNVLLPPLTSFVTYITTTALPAVHTFGHELATKLVPVDAIKKQVSTITTGISDFITGLKGPKKPTVTVNPKLAKLPQSALELGHADVTVRAHPKVVMPGSALSVGHAQMQVKPTLDGSAMSIAHLPSSAKKAQKSQAQQLGDQVRKLISGGIGDALRTAWKGIDWGKLGRTIGSGLGTAIGWVGEHMADLTKKVIKALEKLDYVQIGKSFGKMAIPLAIGIVTSLFDPLFSLDFWRKHWLDTIIAVVSAIPIGRLGGALGKVLEHVPVLKMFSPFLKRIGSIGKLIEKPMGKILEGVGAVAKGIGRGFVTGFEKVFPEASRTLSRRLDDFILRVYGVVARIGVAGSRLVEGLKNGIIKGAEGVGSLIGRVIGYITKPFTTAGSWLVGRGSAAVTGLRTGIASGAARLGTWVSDHMVKPVTGAFARAGSWLVSRGSSIVSGMRSGITSGARGLGGWVKTNVIDKVTGQFAKAGTWLTGSGAALASGLFSGALKLLSDAKNGVLHWAGTVKNKIVGAIKSVFGIHSPSRVMAELGGHMMAGLLKGLLSGKKVLNAAVKGLFHSPIDAAENLLSNGISLPGKWVNKLLSAKAPRSADLPLGPGVASAQQYAQKLVGQLWPGSSGAEWKALEALWRSESGWRANAMNPSSGAYGIPQALPGNKMASAGSDWRTNAATQIRWGLSYIRGRYGDPQNAWESWNAHSPHWYAKGTPGGGAAKGWAWVGERGPELVRFGGGETVLSHLDSLIAARGAGIKVPGYASGTTRARRDVASAQGRVNSLERRITRLRHAEATAHTKRQRKADQLAIMAAENELKAAKKKLTAANKELTAANAQAKRVKTVSNTLANGFLKTIETGTASAIASAVKGMNTKLQAAGAGSLVAGNNRTSAKLQSLANQRSSIQSKISAAKSYASDQATSLGDYLGIGGTSGSTVSDLLIQMQHSQSTAKKFAAEVAKLSKMGLSKTLLSQLADAGPGSQLASILSDVSQFDVSNLNKMAASQNKLTTSYGNTLADAMYDSGSQAGKGFLTGLQAQEKAIQAEMNKLAAGMVSTIKKKLGIHSPSRVMRDQVGKQVALGAAAGVRQHGVHAVRETQRMADLMGAVRARGGAGVAPGGRGGAVVVQTPAPIIHIHFDDPALRDLISAEAEPVARGEVERFAKDLMAAAANTGG